MSRHPEAYRALKTHPEMVPVIAAQEDSLTGRQYRFIPKARGSQYESFAQCCSRR